MGKCFHQREIKLGSQTNVLHKLHLKMGFEEIKFQRLKGY